ncbi:MAG: hypothetical protein COY58_02320 [Gammaproteobacteria bacterium CG_4_10_14_0_8_um_filter_38_16]|nr:MAG: hypothetical protein COY58_02320 [Gammaproteobacteria bacterium CG_4_10_14_0_8_um_filter_38_16]PJA03770.1 MAG: hypothetical protein COX72_02480 [Gammaproteobacteria bacterium CG_4_10_14_0_2_um_filter_38_22]PJB10381.1 MAG: hypothetical protein CO120_05025 [Gammaproteobacteria bacterium CG_4_9_14_3_um_filter_38_9]
MKKYMSLFFWIVALLFLGNLSAYMKSSQSNLWYAALHKSSLTPPSIAFPIAWTLLYIMVAIVGWMIWKDAFYANFRKEKILYLLQLAVNFCWMPIFFYFHSLALSFFVIALLSFLVGWLLISLFFKHPLSSFLLWPYFIWVVFAGYLNYFIWMNN